MDATNDPTIVQFGSKIADLNKQIERVNTEMADYEKKVQGQPEKEQQIKDLQNMPPASYWGDQRLNPLFLKVAEYFGIDNREYIRAESKLTTILNWASAASNSKKASDILKTISDTSKSLQSAAYGEKPYAILYRYVKLAQQDADIKKEMSIYKK